MGAESRREIKSSLAATRSSTEMAVDRLLEEPRGSLMNFLGHETRRFPVAPVLVINVPKPIFLGVAISCRLCQYAITQ